MAASTLESRMTPRSAPPAADRKLASSEYLFNLARKHCPGFANIVLSSELRYAGSGNVSPSERFSERHLADCVKALMRRRWMLGVTVDEKGATDGKSGGKAQLVWHPDAEPGPSHVHLASVEQVLTDLTDGDHGSVAGTGLQGFAYGKEVDLAFEAEMDKLVNELMVFPFSSVETPPYMRVCALSFTARDGNGEVFGRRYGLGLAVHHTISDMQAASALFTEMVTCIFSSDPLTCTAAGAHGAPVPPPTSLEIMPKNRKGLWRFLFGGGVQAAAGMFADNDRDLTAFNTASDTADAGQAVTVRIDAATTASIVAEAKRLGIKVHGMLTAAAMLAHRDEILADPNPKLRKKMCELGIIPQEEASKGTRSRKKPANKPLELSFPVTTTVDVRRHHCPPLPPNTIVSISYGVGNSVALPLSREGTAEREGASGEQGPISALQKQEFAKVAKQCHQDIHKLVSNGSYWFCAWVSESLPLSMVRRAAKSFTHGKNPEMRVPLVNLANLGVLDESGIPAGVTLHNPTAYFNPPVAKVLYITAITTREGMAIGLTGLALSVAQRRRFGHAMVSLLSSAVQR